MIQFIDTGSTSTIVITGSFITSGTTNVRGSGSAVLTISGAIGGMLEVLDSTVNDVFSVSYGTSGTLFSSTINKTVNIASTLNVSTSISSSFGFAGLFASASYAVSTSNALTASFASAYLFNGGTLTGSFKVGNMFVSGGETLTISPGTATYIWNPGTTTKRIYRLWVYGKDTNTGTIPNVAWIDEITCYVAVGGSSNLTFDVRNSWNAIGTPNARTYAAGLGGLNPTSCMTLSIAGFPPINYYIDWITISNNG